MRAACLLLACLAIGCGEESPRLYCGAGLRPPVAELVAEFSKIHGVSFECDYRGSEVLLSTIQLTGEGDLYLPGDVHYVEMAERKGLVAEKRTVCYFIPVILVQRGNPRGIETLEDLLRPEVELGLGDPEACAIGGKSSLLFEKNGIPEESLNIVTRTATVNELGNYVALGSLDAAIVWDAVAGLYPARTEIVSIPRERNVISTVAAGLLRSAARPESAREFAAFLTSERGREVFRKHHYTVELPDES